MRSLLATLLIPLLAMAGSNGIRVSGSSSYFYSYSSAEKGWSEVPSSFWRWRFNPVVNVYGVPVVASVFVSSQESMERQDLNRIYISSSPSASSRDESILSFISTIGVGAFNPYFSNLTLNAANISGVNLAIDPGRFHLAVAGGRNRRPVEASGSDPGVLQRDIYAIQTGLGSPYGSHLHLCLLHGEDREGSIEVDSTFMVTPQENWVTSIDMGALLAGGRVRIQGELAGSVLTRDTGSPDVDSDKVPRWLLDLTGINVSSGFGWAFNALSSVRFSENTLSLSLSRVEPGFSSMGAPYLRNDRMMVEARAERYFMGRQMNAGVYYRWDRDNLAGTRSATTTGNSYGVRIGLAFMGYPRLNVSYSPSSMDSDDSTGFDVNTSTLAITTSYRRDMFGLDVNSSAAVSIHDNSMGSGSGDYSMVSGTLRETVMLEYPVVLNVCLSSRRTRMDSMETWCHTGDVRGTWYPSEDLSLTMGGYYSGGGGDRRIGAVAEGGFPIMDWLTGQVSGEYTGYSSMLEDDRTILSAGAGLTVIW